MRITAADTFDALPELTSPGAPVAPVVAALDSVATSLRTARPALEQANASAWMLGEMERIRAATLTLRDALEELRTNDGMAHFDAAFAADEPGWDAWFSESARLVRVAQHVLAGEGAARPVDAPR